MRNAVIIILAVALAVLAVAGLMLYPKYQEMEKALQECKKAESQAVQMKPTMEALVASLKEQIQKQEVTIKEFQKGLSVSLVDRILFDFGKATLTPEGEKVLKKVGEALKPIKDQKIRIIGHADNRPILREYQHIFPSNWELSAARAATVVRYFQEKGGLDPLMMEAVGRSFYEPVASQDTEKGRAQNRRVEIFIAPKMEVKGKEVTKEEARENPPAEKAGKK